MSQNNSTTSKIIKTNKQKHIGEHNKSIYSGKQWKREDKTKRFIEN